MRTLVTVAAALGALCLSSGVASAQAARAPQPMQTMGSSNGMLNNDSNHRQAYDASARDNATHNSSFYNGTTSDLSKADKKLLKRCNRLSDQDAAKDTDCQALLTRLKADKGS